MSRAVSFRQADVERALRAAKAVGCEHPTVDIWPDGRMRLLTEPQAEPKPADAFEAWEKARGDRAA